MDNDSEIDYQELTSGHSETEDVSMNTVDMPTAIPEQPVAKVEEIESVENEENMIATLQKLREQINALKIEKARVIESEEKMRAKIEAEIEAKRHNIEGLKAEIPVLKQRCEKLANVLQIPVCK